MPVRVIKHWPSPMVPRKANTDVKFLNKKDKSFEDQI